MIQQYLKFYIGQRCCFVPRLSKVVKLQGSDIDHWNEFGYKLALRKIDDVTDDEWKEIQRKFDTESDSSDEQRVIIVKGALITMALIELCVDVFDLIERELVLNIKELKSQL